MSRRPTNAPPEISPAEQILTSILERTVRLPEAACVGRWELFDPPGEGESRETVQSRHSAAVAVCWTCPAIGACREWSINEHAWGAVSGGQLPNLKEKHDVARGHLAPTHDERSNDA